MAQRKNPEYLVFQKNYVLLCDFYYGINSITKEAYAARIIGTDLRDKCLNEDFKEIKRTKFFLDAVEAKVKYVPETLEKLIEILKNKITGYEYIADKLSTSLKEVKEKEYSYAIPTSDTLLGNASPAGYKDATSTLTDRTRSLNIPGSEVFPFTERGGGFSATPPAAPTQQKVR